MKKSYWFVLGAMLGLTPWSCTSPQMLIDTDLQASTQAYEVKGRNGWLVNQHLRFGEFHTGKIKRSWTKGYDFPFLIRFTGAKEKLSYTLQDNRGNEAEIFCLGKLREQDLMLFHKHFDINVKAKDAFTGSVALGSRDAWDFYIMNLNQNNWNREAKGYVLGKGMEVSIRPVNRLHNGKRSLAMQVPGFEFVQNERVVAAVETLNNGKIWLHSSLNEEQRLILAGAATALLLRSELADHNDKFL